MVYVVREPSNIVIDFTVQDPDCDSTAAAALATSLTPGVVVVVVVVVARGHDSTLDTSYGT